ncbi:NAD(P)/FAD-dependent oxidoreductase [Rhizobacter sp. OV335]|uniref:NAD(P)/FAD-dependent oxidoreductase n=1 Tax=Rhizobacter sp. OV335 TaxID=1500264 RepID=UPI00091BD361|nr:NAD(P)/FAD-dependent oxidoreductase [Rhizobacter sp. OV335]SHM26734.1 Thioredoxin reductase [Rhizobacter sp. OV335]
MPIETLDASVDAVVIGGSFAGLSAALQLARARRTVAVIDDGAPRNRFAARSHGFFAQDGTPPLQLIAAARERVQAYPTVQFVSGRALRARRVDDGNGDGDGGRQFSVSLDDGRTLAARRLLLAIGVQDTFPDIDGLAPRWGASVLHCPYCHGYEEAGRRLGVLSAGPASVHHALLIKEWGPTTLLLNGQPLADDEARRLRAHGVAIEPAVVQALEGPLPRLSAVRLADGRSLPLEALFVAPRVRIGHELVDSLGCELIDGPFGPMLRVDELKQTSVPGVYAAGDAAHLRHNATFASADGVLAGVSMHHSLIAGLGA